MGGQWALRGRAERLAGQAAYDKITSDSLGKFTLREWDVLARKAGIMQLPGKTERVMATNIVRAVEEAEALLHEDPRLPGMGDTE